MCVNTQVYFAFYLYGVEQLVPTVSTDGSVTLLCFTYIAMRETIFIGLMYLRGFEADNPIRYFLENRFPFYKLVERKPPDVWQYFDMLSRAQSAPITQFSDVKYLTQFDSCVRT